MDKLPLKKINQSLDFIGKLLIVVVLASTINFIVKLSFFSLSKSDILVFSCSLLIAIVQLDAFIKNRKKT